MKRMSGAKRRAGGRRVTRRPRRLGVRRPLRLRTTVPDIASASESITFTGIAGATPPTALFNSGIKNTTFTAYRNTDISLSTFARAPAIGANYQYFRIKYFELSIIPDADTFVATAGAIGKPFFYYMLDKGNTINNSVSNQSIKAMGAKPIALDEKAIKIRWKPGVVLATEVVTATGTTSAQKYMISPWLNTDSATNTAAYEPSQVCHYGIKWFVENLNVTMTYTATLTAHFEFKKPLFVAPNDGVVAE